MIINIRYCGGCNPRYDRMEIAQRLKAKFSHHTYLVNSPEAADIVVVLCGCSAACTDVSECYGEYGKFVFRNESEWKRLCDFITSIEEKEMRL